MRKVIATLAVLAAAVVLPGALHANFTLFDQAKDSMFIARGEFSSLERTNAGDRLTLRCDEIIKGDIVPGTEVVLEAFEKAPSDEALGRDVIVAFNLVHEKYYFLNHPYPKRAFTFETDDVADDGLDRNEQALRAFVAINAPYKTIIEDELRKRIERNQLGYQGTFDQPLLDQWRGELLTQTGYAGTRAARDAAKALVEHTLFKETLNVGQIQIVSDNLTRSAVGTVERAYMLELVRTFPETHPGLPLLIQMLQEETSQACVGKLANLMVLVEDREGVLAAVGSMATDPAYSVQSRINALQMLQAMGDTDGLVHIHNALLAELESPDFDKDLLRRAFKALRDVPDPANVPVLQTCLDHSVVSESRELTERAWLAFAMVDTEETNATLRTRFLSESNVAKKRFFERLLPHDKMNRKLMMIHNED